MCTDCGSNLKQFFFFAYIPDCLASLLRLSTTLSSFEPFCMPEIPAGSVADCKRDELLPKLDSLKSITKKKKKYKNRHHYSHKPCQKLQQKRTITGVITISQHDQVLGALTVWYWWWRTAWWYWWLLFKTKWWRW